MTSLCVLCCCLPVSEDEQELQSVEIDALFRRYPRLNNQIKPRDVPEFMQMILEKVRVYAGAYYMYNPVAFTVKGPLSSVPIYWWANRVTKNVLFSSFIFKTKPHNKM